jgi:hypothetical protein
MNNEQREAIERMRELREENAELYKRIGEL